MILGAPAWAHAVIAAAGPPGTSVAAQGIGQGVVGQAPPPQAPAGQGEEFGKTSPIALVVILLLGIATALLIRSMNKRLRNVPASFDDPPADDGRSDTGRSDTRTSDTGRSDSGASDTGSDAAGDDPPRVGSS